MTRNRFGGVLVPVLTPFADDGTPDSAAFIRHCRWLLQQGADGLAVFGTTSEANSMSVEERMDLLDALIEAGVDAATLLPGTGACAIPDSVRLSAHATSRGCRGVLMLPPFYYKGVSDDGLYAAFAEVIDLVGDDRLRVYLYHIPPMANVGISLNLIERLLHSFPSTVVGLKDSGGDWENTRAVLTRCPELATFPGSEIFLLEGLRAGAAGCITATGNVNPAGVRVVYERWQEPVADRLQARISEIRQTIQAFPMIPALKHLAALFYEDDQWSRVRPPLTALSDEHCVALTLALEQIQFDMATSRASVLDHCQA